MRRGASVALLSTLCACQSERIVHFDVPDLGTASSVVAALTAGDHLELVAEDVTNGKVHIELPADLPVDTTARIELLAFVNTLEANGLGEGRLEPNPEGRSLPTPDPNLIYAAQLIDGEPTAWAKTAAASGEVVGYRFGETVQTACFDLEITEQRVAILTGVVYGVRIGAHTALIGGESGAALVSSSGVRPVTIVPANARLTAATVDEQTDLWLAGRRGELYRGDLTDTRLELTRVATSTHGAEIHSIAVSRLGGGLDVLVLDTAGYLQRYDGTSWTELHRFDLDGDDHESTVALAEEGVAIAVDASDREIVFVEPTGPRPFEWPYRGFTGLPVVVGHYPELRGTYFATTNGVIIRLRNGEWNDLGAAVELMRMNALASWEGSLFWGGRPGVFGQSVELRGHCPSNKLTTPEVQVIVALDDALVIAGDHNGPDNFVAIAKKR